MGRTAPTLLLTGFEPFSKFRVNSSWESIRELDGETILGWRLAARRLPVSFRRAGPLLRREIRRLNPGAVISFGLAPERRIRLECLAVNIDHDGRTVKNRPIDPRGPLAVESRLPLEAMLRRLRRLDMPARLSFHAGTYLCNHVFYLLPRDIPSGFVHVPPIGRGWTLARLRRAVGEIVLTGIKNWRFVV